MRWSVAGERFSGTFAAKALVDSHRAKLLTAIRNGEPFDTVTGLPDSMVQTDVSALTWYEFARSYVAIKWRDAAAKSRDSISETLTTVTLALLSDRAGRPAADVLRSALRQWAFVPTTWPVDGEDPAQSSAPIAVALSWIGKASLPLSVLKDPDTMRTVLEAIKTKLDGTSAAAQTVRRKRAVLYNALALAVERGEFSEHPMQAVTWKRPKVSKAVDRRVVVNPRQARELLTAVTYVGGYRRARGRRLAAFFACMYYGGLRPGEVTGLCESDCQLPAKGWGTLILWETRPTAGKRWTDSGESQDRRGLKNRAEEDIRPVPIPPVLVRILRAHLEEFGTAKDGRLFFNERKGVLGASTYSQVWDEARILAFTPDQVASPMAGRPYDLRHAALSTWLNSGVDPTEVAERAGNSVEVLLSRYAKCLDGRAAAVNRRIERSLNEDDDQDDEYD